MKQPALWVVASILIVGTACVKRDALVPLVCQPREGAPGIVLGTVRDAQTGAPLIGAKVEVWGDGSSSSTDLAGKYMITNLRPGRYTLMVSYMGYGRGQQLVMIRPDQATTADIRVKPFERGLNLTGPTPRPEPALELGALAGTHCVSSYPVQWIWDEELLTQRADMVGAQTETEIGPVVAGLRTGLLCSYAQSVWVNDDPVNQYRTRLWGGDIRLSGAVRRPLLQEKLSAQVGIAVALDYYTVWSWSERSMNSTTVAEALYTGLRWKPGKGVSLGLDVDLNLARQGYTNHFFSDTGPSPFLVFRIGTMSPSVVLSVLFPVGRRQLRPRRDGPKPL